MKRFIALVIAAIMLFSLAACGTSRESAQSVAENAIKAVQQLDTEQMQKYWGTDKLDTGNGDGFDASEGSQAMVKNLTYEIVSAEETDSTATVKVKFTNVDVGAALSDAVVAVLQKAFAGEETTEEDTDAEFIKALNSGNYDKVTKETTITLTLKDDAWVIDTANRGEVFNAMLADVNTVLDSLSKGVSSEA